MFEEGLFDEVSALHKAGYSPESPGLKAIGYKEFFVHDGNGGIRVSNDFPELERLIARNSRRYAKRQILYFSSLPNVHWIESELGIHHVINEIQKLLKEFLEERPLNHG